MHVPSSPACGCPSHLMHDVIVGVADGHYNRLLFSRNVSPRSHAMSQAECDCNARRKSCNSRTDGMLLDHAGVCLHSQKSHLMVWLRPAVDHSDQVIATMQHDMTSTLFHPYEVTISPPLQGTPSSSSICFPSLLLRISSDTRSALR